MRSRLQHVGATDEQWMRVVMNQQTRALVQALPIRELRVLEISGEDWKGLPFKSYKALHFPEFDITAQVLPETFDLIIAEQVFEHLLWPYRAGRNVYAMLAPGGHFLNTTPFFIKIHNHPTDCSRWTPTGMKYFLAECGFPLEKIRTESWGNRDCVRSNLRGWTPYRPGWHSLRNETDYPMVVWALAQKEGGPDSSA